VNRTEQKDKQRLTYRINSKKSLRIDPWEQRPPNKIPQEKMDLLRLTNIERKESITQVKGMQKKSEGKKLKSSVGSRQGNKAHQGRERGPGDGSPHRCSKARRQPAPPQQKDAESVQKGTAEAA